MAKKRRKRRGLTFSQVFLLLVLTAVGLGCLTRFGVTTSAAIEDTGNWLGIALPVLLLYILGIVLLGYLINRISE